MKSIEFSFVQWDRYMFLFLPADNPRTRSIILNRGINRRSPHKHVRYNQNYYQRAEKGEELRGGGRASLKTRRRIRLARAKQQYVFSGIKTRVTRDSMESYTKGNDRHGSCDDHEDDDDDS